MVRFGFMGLSRVSHEIMVLVCFGIREDVMCPKLQHECR